MKRSIDRISFGGGCHWCTEAVFQTLYGVHKVEQGFVASSGVNSSFSEAVVVHFDASRISLATLIEIHLNTHKSTSDHSMREKYRSAVYTFSETQAEEARRIIANLQEDFKHKLITRVFPFKAFKPSEEQFTDYYYTNPEKPFCRNHIRPKIKLLMQKFSSDVDTGKTTRIITTN